MKKLVFILLVLPLIASARFDRNLYFGMRNDLDVKQLQDFLRDQGHFTFPTSTGNYFQVTLDAVKKFQKARGISVVSGYFGPQSRAAANDLLLPGVSGGISATPSSGYVQTIKPAPSPTAVVRGISPYKGKIRIGSVYGSANRPEGEMIVLENRTEKEKIDITGFSLLNSRGDSFTIPKGHELPGFTHAPEDSIVLKPRDRAQITAGRQRTWFDFRDNICVGYLDDQLQFEPPLSHRCPWIETRNLGYLSDRCLSIIRSTDTCRRPSFTGFVEPECSDFLNGNLSYASCVRDNRNTSEFYSSEWLIWMQKSNEFIRNVSETIVLKDQQGNEVDRYSY